MKDIKLDRGERLDIRIDDTESVKAQFLVSESFDTPAIIDVEATFTDGSAYISLLNTQTDIPEGDYIYQVRLYDNDGEFIVLDSDCGKDCETSKFVVCPVIKEA